MAYVRAGSYGKVTVLERGSDTIIQVDGEEHCFNANGYLIVPVEPEDKADPTLNLNVFDHLDVTDDTDDSGAA